MAMLNTGACATSQSVKLLSLSSSVHLFCKLWLPMQLMLVVDEVLGMLVTL